jgi:hypothetical protein
MKFIRIWLVRLCSFNFFQGKKGIGYSWSDLWHTWKNYQDRKQKQK